MHIHAAAVPFFAGEKGNRKIMGEKEKGRSRKKRNFPLKVAVVTGAMAVMAVLTGAGYYIYRGRQYETVFFPSTKINGIDASEKTVEQMKKLISEEIDNYVLTIKKRGGETEEITGADIGLHSVFDGELEQYLANQEPMEWWSSARKQKNYEVQAMTDFDEAKLDEKIASLELLKDENMEPPKDAYLSEYVPGEGYVVMPEEPGTILNKEKAADGIREAVRNMETEVEVEKLDVYEEAAITSEDPGLNELAGKLNKYVNTTVTYAFGEKQEVLGGELISQWIVMEEDGEISLSQEAVAAYVKDLAAAYDTAYHKKVLKTSYGRTVEIEKGFYGWRMDQRAEAEQLYQILLSGESQVREPVYQQTGASHGENDYGDTYVEINLTAQHLFFYKDGQLLVESDFVSGNAARGYDTPSGAYPLTYKQRNAVLRGANYASPVSYWMPFNKNIGMHDASWRGSFGGNIYKTNGSHGCINLPREAAKTIFENIEKGMPVLCYHLEGTESSKGSRGGGSAGGTVAAAAETPAPAPAAPQETAADPGIAAAPDTGAAVETLPEETLPEESILETESQPAETQEEIRTGNPWDYGPGVTTQAAENEGGSNQPETAAPEAGGEPSEAGPA